jgi:hypothetical protein
MPQSNAQRQKAFRERQKTALHNGERAALRSPVTEPVTTPVTMDRYGPDWLHDPSKRTPGAVAAWLIETFPHAIDRIIGALQRQRATAFGESKITISWEAGRGARDLARLWSTERLDELRQHLAEGAPARMTEAEKLALWGSERAPKSISIPDDPREAAAKLWLFWGQTPGKLTRLRSEIARRTKAPKPPPAPRSPPEDPDIPF